MAEAGGARWMNRIGFLGRTEHGFGRSLAIPPHLFEAFFLGVHEKAIIFMERGLKECGVCCILFIKTS